MNGRDDTAVPLSPAEARQLARGILKRGRTIRGKHAKEKMAERNLRMANVDNVLRCGRVVDEPESNERGSFSYKFETNAMAVVVAFVSETSLKVITAYRFDRRKR